VVTPDEKKKPEDYPCRHLNNGPELDDYNRFADSPFA
jgi:hypothetical protein